ncbi:MAG: hypothetical protein ACRDON_10275 [Gaiellaceae bacterium]
MRRLLVLSLLSLFVLPPQAAAGGGWWSFIQLDRSTVAPGQQVNARDEVWFKSAAAADAARDTEFYVYVLHGLDYSMVERAMRKASPGDWWSLGGASAVRAGRVVVSGSAGSNLARARATFEVPPLPPGRYSVMLCNAGCTHPLGDVVPTQDFTIAADRIAAATAAGLKGLRSRTAHGIAALRGEARRARAVDTSTRFELEQVRAELKTLQERTLALGRQVRRPLAAQETSPWAYAGWLIAGVLLGATALILLRKRTTTPPPILAVRGGAPPARGASAPARSRRRAARRA